MSKKPSTQAAATPPAVPIAPADLAARMKRDRGGPQVAQVKVLEQLLALAGDGQEIEMPSLNALAAATGLSRQAVANALVRLRARQLVEERQTKIPIVHRHRTIRFIMPHMPGELRQMDLPFAAAPAA